MYIIHIEFSKFDLHDLFKLWRRILRENLDSILFPFIS